MTFISLYLASSSPVQIMRCLFKGAGFSGLSANHKTAFTTTHPLVFDFLEILFTFYFFVQLFSKL